MQIREAPGKQLQDRAMETFLSLETAKDMPVFEGQWKKRTPQRDSQGKKSGEPRTEWYPKEGRTPKKKVQEGLMVTGSVAAAGVAFPGLAA